MSGSGIIMTIHRRQLSIINTTSRDFHECAQSQPNPAGSWYSQYSMVGTTTNATTTTTDSHHHHNHQTSPSGYHSQVIRKNVLSAVRNDLIMGRFCLRRHYYLIALISLSVCLSGQKLATCRGLYQYTTDLSHKKSLVARCDK